MNFFQKFFKNTPILLLTLVVGIVFLGSLILVPKGDIFISPDETANAFFSMQLARTGSLFSFDAINVAFDDMIHPRSVVSMDGRLLPGSFIGLPVLYGLVNVCHARHQLYYPFNSG